MTTICRNRAPGHPAGDTDSTTPRTPVTPHRRDGDADPVRLAFIDPPAERTTLDGAWWPRTRSPSDELPGLVKELDRRGVRVTRVATTPSPGRPPATTGSRGPHHPSGLVPQHRPAAAGSDRRPSRPPAAARTARCRYPMATARSARSPPRSSGARCHEDRQTQPLVRAPLSVALQNLELIASCPAHECGQTSQAAIPLSEVVLSRELCSGSLRTRASHGVAMDVCAGERVTVAHA